MVLETVSELVPILQFIAVILILSYLFGQVVEYLDWRIRKRRMWKQIEKRTKGKDFCARGQLSRASGMGIYRGDRQGVIRCD